MFRTTMVRATYETEGGFSAFYIRAIDNNKFELVAQQISCHNGDFTFDECVVETKDTPFDLIQYVNSPAFDPSLFP